jgi:hypothetical protein
MTKGPKLSLTGATFPSKFEFAKACLSKTVPDISNMAWVEKTYTSKSTWESLSLQEDNFKKTLTVRIFKMQLQNGFGTHCGT